MSLGVNRERLSTLVHRGILERTSRGWYRCVGAPQSTAVLVGAIIAELDPRVAARLVVGHETAALLHQLRTPHRPSLERVTVICAPHEQRPDYRPNLTVLPAGIGPDDVVLHQGMRVTSLSRTALDLARGLALEYALVSVDHALALGAPRQELWSARKRMPRWPGARSLDAAIECGSAQAESALESMSRGVMIRAGIPSAQLQRQVQGASGKWWRPDFCWPEQRLIGEADGQGKYATRTEHGKEKFRDEDLRCAGWRVVHWTFEHMLTGDQPAIGWLAQALEVQPIPLHRRSSAGNRRVA